MVVVKVVGGVLVLLGYLLVFKFWVMFELMFFVDCYYLLVFVYVLVVDLLFFVLCDVLIEKFDILIYEMLFWFGMVIFELGYM